MTRSLFIPVLLLLLLAGSAGPAAHGQTAQELLDSGQLIIRTRLEPEGPVLVGQKTILWIEILTSTWFTSAPRLPDTLDIPNAVVMVPDSFGVNLNERIGGASFAGQARRFLIFPQGAGQFSTPEVPLTLTVALESGGPSPQLSLTAPAQLFEAQPPPGSEGLGLVLAAPGLRVSEQWDPQPGEMKVGQSITRTVTVTIDDAVGMLLPPLEMEAVEGVGLYPGNPEINDRANRGQLTGSRSDSATLIMEEEGTYQLPEVVYHWWDLGQNELKMETLPAVTITVVPNPDLAAEHLGEKPVEEDITAAPVVEAEDSRNGRLLAAAAGLAVILLLLFRRRIARIPAALADRRRRRAEGEAHYFVLFRRTAATGDAGRTMAALMAWLDRAGVGDEPTLQAFVERANDPELAGQAAALERRLFGRPGDRGAEAGWSGERFSRLVARARKSWPSGGEPQQTGPTALPPLNPVTAADR